MKHCIANFSIYTCFHTEYDYIYENNSVEIINGKNKTCIRNGTIVNKKHTECKLRKCYALECNDEIDKNVIARDENL